MVAFAGTAERLGPQAGAQHLFASCPADIVFAGGAAGGGKTWSQLYEAAKWVHLPRYEGRIFRRQAEEIERTGLWDKALEFFRPFKPRARGKPTYDLRFPSGAVVGFGHLQHQKTAKSYQGAELGYLGFEELTHFEESQFWYLRSRNRTTSAMRQYTRATLNPDPDHFARGMVDWWIGPDGYAIPERSGIVRWFVRIDEKLHWADTRRELLFRYPLRQPTSFTFILATLEGNRIFRELDPIYGGDLENLPELERMRLLGERDEHGRDRGGNWNVREKAGDYFDRAWFPVTIKPPARIVKTVRCWDKAATRKGEHRDAHFSAGVKLNLMTSGEWYADDVVEVQETPGGVLAAMRAAAERDGTSVRVVMLQDTGQAGQVDADTTLKALHGFRVGFIKTSEINALALAEAMSSRAQRGMIYIKRAEWTGRLLAMLHRYPKRPRDAVDALAGAFHALPPPIVLTPDDRELPTTRI